MRVTRREMLGRSALGLGAGLSACLGARKAGAGEGGPPNILLILADDLGYGDLGAYGQQLIQTPNLDRMSAEGMRFTQFYAGSTVCAPSRGCLMTGLHTGHARIRGNGLQYLRPEDLTVAEVLHAQGYETVGFGKWGLGDRWSPGLHSKQGFDHWFGYLNHLHAHNYYPSVLYWNDVPVPIPGNLGGRQRSYSHDLFTDFACNFIERRSVQSPPFFLFLPYTIPHANTVGGWLGREGMPVPDDAPYSGEPWPQVQRNYAAMITRLDRDIGRILDTLDAQGLAGNTLVLFTSDNGPHAEGGADPAFFTSAGPLRGIKRDLYEGGIRVPLIARWPGRIEAGAEAGLPCAGWDFMATFAELAGAAAPAATDSLSLVPTLLGEARAGRAQEEHDFLYWEFGERGFRQALRAGDWKAISKPGGGGFDLYNLADDPGETQDLAAAHPEVLSHLLALLATARTEPPGRRPFLRSRR